MYTVYKVINKLNEKYYIGVHETDNPNDDYMGSGVAIRSSILKHGVENFYKEILHIFDSKEDAYSKEVELLEDVWKGASTYNMSAGGRGSWSHIDSTGENNCMKDPETVRKVVANKHKNGSYHTDAFIESSMSNLEKAMSSWTGSKHTEETKAIMGEKSKKHYAENREYIVAKAREVRHSYTLVSPEEDIIELGPGELNEFCKTMGFAVSVFSTKPDGYIVKRGKAKGWRLECRT